jgi:hypothetical protein
MIISSDTNFWALHDRPLPARNLRARAHHADGPAVLLLLRVRDLKAQEEGNGRKDPATPRARAVNLSQISARHSASLPALLARARSDEAAVVLGPATAVVQVPVAAATMVGAPLALPPPRPRMCPPPRCPPRLPRP